MKSKTHIKTTKSFDKKLRLVPDYIRKKFMFWVFMVEKQGIREARKFKGLHDEPLQGRRWGQRSIRLSRSYRAIYIEKFEGIEILMIEVHKHDY